MNGEEASEPHISDHVNVPEKTPVDPAGLLDSGEIPSQNFDVHRIVLFSEIACGTAEVIIEHEGQRYRLRATRNGRLLLNK